MTVQQVKNRVSAIEAVKRDFEVAHSMEDELYIEVLRAIVAGVPDIQELAEAALESQAIDFVRVTA
jgi:hypothetical protein